LENAGNINGRKRGDEEFKPFSSFEMRVSLLAEVSIIFKLQILRHVGILHQCRMCNGFSNNLVGRVIVGCVIKYCRTMMFI
jgi:hypothetical protein